MQWKENSKIDADKKKKKKTGKGVSPAVLLMVCARVADGVVSSVGPHSSLPLSLTSSLTYTSALALDSPQLMLFLVLM